MINEKNIFPVSDGGSTRRSVSTLLSETLFVSSLSIRAQICGILE